MVIGQRGRSGVAALCRDEEEEGQRGFSRRRGRTSTIAMMEMMRMTAAAEFMLLCARLALLLESGFRGKALDA
jgi:hypothetical protein